MKKSMLKKSSWSPPEGQFSSLDLFVRQCCLDIDRLNHSRRKRPSNLSTDGHFKSLRSRNDVTKPAEKVVPLLFGERFV